MNETVEPESNIPHELQTGFVNGHIWFRVLTALYVFIVFLAAGSFKTRLWSWLVPVAVMVLMTLIMKFLGGVKIHRYTATVHPLLDITWHIPWIKVTQVGYSSYPMHQLFVDAGILAYLVAQTHGVASVFFLLFPVVLASGDLVLHGRGHWWNFLKWRPSEKKRLFSRHVEFTFWVLCLAVLSGIVAYKKWIGQFDELELVRVQQVHLKGQLFFAALFCQVVVQVLLGYVANRTSKAFVVDVQRRAKQ